MAPLCPSCLHPREVGYGIECFKGDQVIFIRNEDTRPHYRNKCKAFRKEIVPGLTQGLIDRVLAAQGAV